MRKNFLILSVILFLVPLSAAAYGKRRIGNTMPMSKVSTTGVYIDRQVWVPGVWAVSQGTGSLTFTHWTSGDTHQSFVRLTTVSREQCGFGIIRMRALKAWGGSNLDQSQAQIQALSFGTIKFKGYTWLEPSTWGGDRHICMGQDMRSAVEVTVPEGDTDTVKFIRNDFMLQLAVRNGRSVLPWPQASENSSASVQR